ncbi:uncharacterized protein [Solanum lycopersicum]|uniref:uncharacterized protein n=1 Tax=Solanum lycopersicum TaxID=4081 RepID=UPI000532EC32
MNVHYHQGKANVVAEALSRMRKGSTSHVEDGNKELVKHIHRLARLGVRLVYSTSRGVSVHPSSESSLLVEGKEGQHLDHFLMKLKETVFIMMNKSFALGVDYILRYQDRLCVPDVDNLRTRIIEEAYGSTYSILQGPTKMYHDLKNIYLWDDMKKDIAHYVAKCPNYQQLKANHYKPGGLTQI